MKSIIVITLMVLSSFYCHSQVIKQYTITDGVETKYYSSSIEDGSGNIWFAANKGITKWDGVKFTHLNAKGLNYLYLDKQKNILIYEFNSKTLSKINNNQIVEISKLDRYTQTDDGTVYLVKDNSLFLYEGNDLEKICSDKNSGIGQALLDSKGNVWVTSGKNAYRIKDKKYVRFSAENGYNGELPISYFEDSKGRIWSTTYNAGILCYSDDKWIAYTKKDGLFSDDVCQIVEDKKGIIWATHYKAGISYFDGSNWIDGRKGSGFFSNDPFYNKNIFTPVIKIDSLNNVWFGSLGGDLTKFNGNDWEKLFHINAGSEDLEIFIGKRNQNNIWLKSNTVAVHSGIGMNKYDLRTNKLTNVWESSVYQIVEDNNGGLWFLTKKGLANYNDVKGYSLVIEASKAMAFSCSRILVDKLGKVWFATIDGIYCISVMN